MHRLALAATCALLSSCVGCGGPSGPPPTLDTCPILPANHVFNTPIDSLPVHANSAAFMATIGSHNLHLDLGQVEDMVASDYYGIPFNIVDGTAMSWTNVAFQSTDPGMNWNPRDESDCATGSAHTLVSPCLASTAPTPQLPIPPNPKVEGGVFADNPSSPYADHHILMVDTANCHLWEIYHAYTGTSAPWHIFGSAMFDLRSNALRPSTWTSADAAGFPIFPLLLRADEASTGTINHAVRFTIPSGSIRGSFTWPARHKTGNASSTNLPQMGQLFRLKASYVIPAGFSAQSRAILQALKTYGMYIADGGSAMYIQGDPSASWSSTVFSEVQSVNSSQFEAVDLGPIMARAGFDPDSAAVPP